MIDNTNLFLDYLNNCNLSIDKIINELGTFAGVLFLLREYDLWLNGKKSK